MQQYVISGLGPRRGELTRWYFDDGQREWVVIACINADDPGEMLYEIGPVVGHWGYDAGGTSQRISDLLATRAPPEMTRASAEAAEALLQALNKYVRP